MPYLALADRKYRGRHEIAPQSNCTGAKLALHSPEGLEELSIPCTYHTIALIMIARHPSHSLEHTFLGERGDGVNKLVEVINSLPVANDLFCRNA
jgi:hypothetical protein